MGKRAHALMSVSKYFFGEGWAIQGPREVKKKVETYPKPKNDLGRWGDVREF